MSFVLPFLFFCIQKKHVYKFSLFYCNREMF